MNMVLSGGLVVALLFAYGLTKGDDVLMAAALVSAGAAWVVNFFGDICPRTESNLPRYAWISAAIISAAFAAFGFVRAISSMMGV